MSVEHDEAFHPISREEALREFVRQSADDLGTVIDAASGDDERAELIKEAAAGLEPKGLVVVDMYDVLKGGTDTAFNPSSLEGKTGARTGQTRAQILAGIAMRSAHPKRRPRRI